MGRLSRTANALGHPEARILPLMYIQGAYLSGNVVNGSTSRNPCVSDMSNASHMAAIFDCMSFGFILDGRNGVL